jgi:DNA-directed RNA polymerase subunit RPC12/RpoP
MPKLVTAKCQTCGKESEVEWTLGMKCPACGSPKFFPMVFIDESASRGQRAARSTSQKPVGLILALIFFIVAIGAFAYRLKKTSGQKEYSSTVTMICTNEDCTNPNPLHLFRKKLSTKNPFPHITCPFCKQNTAYRAVRCRNCGEIFALETEGKRNPTLDLVCPNCRLKDIDLDSSSIPVEEEE